MTPVSAQLHKPTILALHGMGALGVADAARALLAWYWLTSAHKSNPCTVSPSRLARELGADPAAVRVALYRWPLARREGANGQRRRAWSVTLRIAPQEQSDIPAGSGSEAGSETGCIARAKQDVSPHNRIKGRGKR
jgi:hypothetical protein